MKIASIIALVISLSLSSASARTLQLTLEELPSKADFVIVGDVLDASGRWDEGGKMIYTDYIIGVKETIVGQPDPIILMSFAGGTVDGKSILVPDSPRLEVGKTYVLFGLANEKSFAPTVGHEQGVFRILSDKGKGKDYVVDYFGNLLETMADGRVVRGRLVDLKAGDRLVFIEQKKGAEVTAPDPVVRDAKGNVVPQPKAAPVTSGAGRGGQPLEKSAFITYIIGQVKK